MMKGPDRREDQAFHRVMHCASLGGGPTHRGLNTLIIASFLFSNRSAAVRRVADDQTANGTGPEALP
jgi:hypothetical protein